MLLSYIDSFLSEIFSYFYPKKKYVKIIFPYHSQWESSFLVDSILNKTIKASEDPKWKNSGAEDPQHYEYWSWNICGTACLKMVLDYKKVKNYPLVALAKKCAEYGGYIPNEKEIEGLFYQPFCVFIKREFNVEAKIAPILSINRIKTEISRGNFIMASVNQTIRDTNNKTPVRKNGHLILVTGYDDEKKALFIHNPSGYYKRSQENHEISEEDFSRFFGKRGLIINNS